MLASYAGGGWYTAPDEGTLVVDASTSDPVARVSTTGLDTRAMVDHARRVGGPALRRLTFQQRAAALKELATYLDANKAAYHELSLATGATRRDGSGDIDGGIGTVFAFASRARRELPDGLLLTDGDVEPIGKERNIRRAARVHVAPGRCAAGQRVQLPGVGHARKARARLCSPAFRRSSNRQRRPRISPPR